MIKVFVYGTLKSGGVNSRLLEGCEFRQAKAKHIVLHSGPSFPFARRGIGTTIGEVYEVSEETLQKLDRLEGHPDFYQREMIEIDTSEAKEKAWIYLCEKHAMKYPVVEDGVWK